MSLPAVHLYRFEGDSRVRHQALLELLSRYARLEPNKIRLRRTDTGKPYLENSDISFNLSHSANLTLVAIARDLALGVDVEAIQARIEPLAIASQFFHPAERAALQTLEESSRLDLFFRIWVRKEAYVKGVGGGLSLGLDSFCVYPQMVGIEPWSIADIEMPPGYAAAVAVKASQFELQWRQFDWPAS